MSNTPNDLHSFFNSATQEPSQEKAWPKVLLFAGLLVSLVVCLFFLLSPIAHVDVFKTIKDKYTVADSVEVKNENNHITVEASASSADSKKLLDQATQVSASIYDDYNPDLLTIKLELGSSTVSFDATSKEDFNDYPQLKTIVDTVQGNSLYFPGSIYSDTNNEGLRSFDIVEDNVNASLYAQPGTDVQKTWQERLNNLQPALQFSKYEYDYTATFSDGPKLIYSASLNSAESYDKAYNLPGEVFNSTVLFKTYAFGNDTISVRFAFDGEDYSKNTVNVHMKTTAEKSLVKRLDEFAKENPNTLTEVPFSISVYFNNDKAAAWTS